MQADKPNPSVDDQSERAKRLEAFIFARGSVRLSGFVLSDEAVAINMQYVNGELTAQGRIDACNARYKINSPTAD